MERKNVLALLTTLSAGLMVTACGMAPSQEALHPSHQAFAMDRALKADGAVHREASTAASQDCNTIKADLEQHREALAATPQWQALTETAAWSDFEAALKKAEDAKCQPHDKDASPACKKAGKAIRKAWGKVKGTSEYDAARSLPEWEVLHEDYTAARENHCWNQW